MAKPIRILQIIGLFERGGVEVWLMEMLRNIDRRAFQIDFLVHVDYPCAFDDEARQLGARILHLTQPKHMPFSYRASWRICCAKMGRTTWFTATCIFTVASTCKPRQVVGCRFESPIPTEIRAGRISKPGWFEGVM